MMKTKDLIALAFALILLVGAGTVFYNQFAPASAKKSAQGEPVEVAPVVERALDEEALAIFTDPVKTRSFAVPFDLTRGVGNDAPFGQ